ncbi:arabinan endo-1,5-alpha-L-arabinosidase [Bacteroidia bacterium]|nr:arabinan endo-1,5-alpha-L-arabinosidase [Bacteroidia bacterium]
MKLLLAAIFALLLASASVCAGQEGLYVNPLTEESLPDPTVMSDGHGIFWLYATEDISGVPIFRSTDLVHWTPAGRAFTSENRPKFLHNGHVWAPDINRIGDRYVLYYTLSRWGEVRGNGIGVAIADRPDGKFEDIGALFTSSSIGVTNSIDQCYIEDNGRKWLFWGSFHGIYAIELSADGLSLASGSEKVRIAGNAYEASYVHHRGDYYYLFASVGSCCAGVNSTYRVVVGRSRSLLGPYEARDGTKMLDNRHETILRGNDRFAGPGHNARIITDSYGNDWMLYHAYDCTSPKGRRLMLDRVDWRNDWPVIGNGTPSAQAESPVF